MEFSVNSSLHVAPSTPTHIANMLPPELLTRGDIVFPHGSNSNKSCAVATAIEGYVRLLVADQVGFLTPIDECGTGYYAVNFKKLRSNMKKRLFEDYVTERYGKDCCRLIRILLDKDKLTDTQLQRISMIPLHDIRRKLEALFIAGIVEIQVRKVSKIMTTNIKKKMGFALGNSSIA